jgi:serine/threonine-protein kinase
MSESTLIPSGKDAVTRIGNYELLEQLGADESGMGVVFKARQVGLDRFVALKVMNDLAVPMGQQAAAKQRFLNEARAMARLDHANIIPIYEVGEHLGMCYISMKFIAGGSLSRQIDSFARRLTTDSTLVGSVASALAYAHSNGVIHRDLKPQNILIDDNSKPIVTDFGLAKLRGDIGLTQPGQILGTPHYMAPEQARGESKDVKEPADIFSLGVVFYRLITGQLPFNGSTQYEIIRQVLEASPERPSKLNPEVDDDLEFICLKCLEKDPNRRYTTGEHLEKDLYNWVHEHLAVERHKWALEEMEKEHPGISSSFKPARSREKEAWRRSVVYALRAATNNLETPRPRPDEEGLISKLKALVARVLPLQSPAAMLRVVLADDHPITLAGIQAELQRLPGVAVVGTAPDGNEALELVRALQPHVVFMDISMPELDGLTATVRISREFPDVRIIILSRHEREEYYWQALKAGACGYMLKRDAAKELAKALLRVMDGEVFLSSGISGRLGKSLTLKTAESQQAQGDQLTMRQRQVLQMMAQGRTIEEIAQILEVSIKTVEDERAQLMHRFQAQDSAGLIQCGLRMGLVGEEGGSRES